MSILIKQYLNEIQEEVIDEAGFYISPDIRRIMDKTPVVTKKIFIDSIKHGDIVLTYSAKKQFTRGRRTEINAKILSTFQGSPYTSSKYAIDDNHVAGYGVKSVKRPEDNVINKINKVIFVSRREEIILVRIPDLTDEQKTAASNFINKRLGTSYNGSDLLKTMWNRLLNRKMFAFLKDKPLTPEEINLIQEPLFCSNLISLALVSAGYTKSFNNKNPWDVWPRDFIVSDNTISICRIEP
jgi:hypothetical protein